MSPVDWVLIVIGAVTVVLAGATLVVAALTLRSTNRDVEVSEENLELARRAEARYPNLEITDVTLTDANEHEVVVRTREAREWWEKAEEEYRNQYEDQSLGGAKAFAKVRKEGARKGYTVGQAHYNGPFPDLILEFRLHNKSSEAVRNLEADIEFDSAFLEPIDFPRLDKGVGVRNAMQLTIDSLPPASSGEARVFKIALLKKESGETTATATLSSVGPEGFYWKEPLDLKVP